MDVTAIAGYITTATSAITALVTCGKTLYPYVVQMLTTLKEGIAALSSDVAEINTALKALVAQIDAIIEQIQAVLAADGLVSEDTVKDWLITINSNLTIIKSAEA